MMGAGVMGEVGERGGEQKGGEWFVDGRGRRWKVGC